jgi:hypothetical protein
LRAITTPSMGEAMTVWAMSTCAWFRLAAAWLTAAWLAFTCAAAASLLARAVSRSLCGSSCSAASAFARSYFWRVSSTSARERSRFARAEATLAWACSMRAWKSDGSRRARTWPFFTVELKSAVRLWMVPETWDPTWTVVTAWTAPVAPTTSITSPRSTAAVA